jgi:hypothetical protein
MSRNSTTEMLDGLPPSYLSDLPRQPPRAVPERFALVAWRPDDHEHAWAVWDNVDGYRVSGGLGWSEAMALATSLNRREEAHT